MKRTIAFWLCACLALSALGLAGTVSALAVGHSEMIENLRASNFYFAGKSYAGKKNAMIEVAEKMLDAGFAPAFVAGALGNVAKEGSPGRFENVFGYSEDFVRKHYTKHNYIAHMNNYTEWCDHNHDHSEYKQYSGKYIYDGFSLSAVSTMLSGFRDEGWLTTCGLGCLQWTWGETIELMGFYQAEAGSSDTITYEQCVSAEAKMIAKKLLNHSSYKYWKEQNAANLNCADAAYSAGYVICVKYEIPADKENQGVARGDIAREIYETMVPSVTDPDTTPTPEPSQSPDPDASPTPEPSKSPEPGPTDAPEPETEVITLSKNATRTAEARRTYQIALPGRKIKSCKSSAAKVASVDDTGLIRALKAGKAKITVTATDKKKFKLTLNVKDPFAPAAVSIEQGAALTVSVGETVALSATLTPDNAITTLKWSSGSKKVAEVDSDGVVTALRAGRAKITVRTANDRKATLALTVVDPNAPAAVTISCGSTLTLYEGDAAVLTATVSPASANQSVTWKSSKRAVADVDADGRVTALKAGTAKITATAAGGKKKATVTVTVKKGDGAIAPVETEFVNGLEIQREN